MPVLLTQIDDPLASAMADGAYDDRSSAYAAIEAHGSGPPPQTLIPPRQDAQMRSRTMASQKTEAALACAILNRMTRPGMPDGYCFA